MLFQRIADLKRQGVAIAYITHKLDELARIGDDVAVMRDGRMIGCAPLSDLSHADIVRMMVGRDVNDLYQKTSSATGDEVLRVERLTLKHPERPGDFLVDDVSFHVRRGEVLGIFGLMGAGRTELLECLFGLHAGPVPARYRRRPAGRPAVAGRRHRRGLALAPEDRKRDGLVLAMSVAENASLACLDRAGTLRAA